MVRRQRRKGRSACATHPPGVFCKNVKLNEIYDVVMQECDSKRVSAPFVKLLKLLLLRKKRVFFAYS
jgi:hypothetical protein